MSIYCTYNNNLNPTGATSLIKSSATPMSPTFEKHLYFPKPSSSAQSVIKIRAPSAISALAWREHIQSKENQKIAKAEAIQKRKLERQKIKKEKESKPVKGKKRKQKQVCGTCDEDLDTDAEDDGLKNVGCDSCPKWFHLKCTDFKNIAYDEVIHMDFVCKACNDQNN